MKKYYLFNSAEQKEYPKLNFEEILPIVGNSSNLNHWLIWTEGYKDWIPLPQSSVYEMLFKNEKTNTAIKPPPLKPAPRSETVIKSQTVIKAQATSSEPVKTKTVEENNPSKGLANLKPVEQNTLLKRNQGSVEPNTISKKIVSKEETVAKSKDVIPLKKVAAETEEPVWTKDERRKHPRVKTRLRVIITNNEKTFLTHCLDVSMGGLKVEKAIPKALFNKECEIYICGADGKESIVFKCTPVGTEGDPNRLQFSESDIRFSEKLASWLDQYKESPIKKTQHKKVG